jgi:hypothetical protein
MAAILLRLLCLSGVTGNHSAGDPEVSLRFASVC